MSTYDWCNDCCDTHEPRRRQSILEPFGNVQPHEVYRELGELAEHLWGRRDDDKRRGGATRMLQRDLDAIRKRNGWEPVRAPEYTPADVARIKNMRVLGFGPKAIARALGNRSRHGIQGFIKRRLSK